MSVKRFICLCVATIMVIAMFASCAPVTPKSQDEPANVEPKQQAGEKPAEPTPLPLVKLIAYFVGTEGIDQDLVLEEVNKILTDKVNATLDIKIIPTADVDQRYPLVFASGEALDMIFAAGWAGYKSHAEKGAFLELTDDMLNEYMPKTMAEMSEINWKPVMVNGKKHMIPRTDYSFNPYVIGVRGDLREKYNLPEIKSLEDYELFLDTIAQNEENILPYGDNDAKNCWYLPTIMLNIPNEWGVLTSGGSDFMHYLYDDLKGDKAFVREETPEFLEWAKKMVEWRKKGYWSASALTSRGGSTDQFMAGKSASFIYTLEGSRSRYTQLQKEHPEWKLEIYDATFGQRVSYTIPIAGFALAANTKNAERVLMVIEEFKNNRELYDIAQDGIEGKHYILTEDGKVKPGPDSGNNGDISFYGLKVGNMERFPAETYPGYEEIIKSCQERQFFNPSIMFSLSVGDNIKNEYAACKNIYDTTRPIINLGFNEDPEKELEEYFKRMKAAGYDKLIEEERNQLIEFMAGF